MVRDLMTPDDVTRRQAAGEDELELSIEKWEILVERWSGEADILDDVEEEQAISCMTCALCMSFICGMCPYCLYYDIACRDFDSHYDRVCIAKDGYRDGVCDRENVVIAAQAMVDSLKEIRKDEGENE